MIQVKASELRMGNWVLAEINANGLMQPHQIMPLDIEAIYNGEMELRCIKVEPIPLTPDILEKCGFKAEWAGAWSYRKQIGESYIKGTIIITLNLRYKNIQISVGTGGDNTNWIYLPIPQNLHSLQNLHFAFTTQELTINL